MIRRAPGIVILLVAVTAALIPSPASSSPESLEAARPGAHRWVRNPLIVSFSSSLSVPSSNIKAGSDVAGALRQALQSWAAVADVQFFETASSAETISPPAEGDGINLISISSANASLFESSDAPARTRVFHDSGGAIVEADIALNPTTQFSTDGTVGTYDLESTFAHEIGHLLGLEHSAVIGATMQPRQARNGTYDRPAFSQRTLSDDDAAQARALYGPTGASIAGRVMKNTAGRARTIFGAHFFAEDVASGRVVASSVSSASGQYRIEGLRAGVYRVFAQPLGGPVTATDLGASGRTLGLTATTPAFRSFVASNSTPSLSLNVSSSANLKLSFAVFSVGPELTPRLIGMNGELSTAPLPVRPGETFTIYVAGEGIDDVSLEGISFSSSYIRIIPESLRDTGFEVSYPVMAFDVTVDGRIQPGDYTIRLQSRGGELAFLPGAISIEGP
ncbi:MAG TPA: matrixin family metalloprotease [Pyrinomonadaceae bacterium]|nr:matrixin family metalloprotease [Pyrinomonadaceae bacterium]